MIITCIAASFVPSLTANSIQVVKAAHALAELGHQVTLLVPGDTSESWQDIRKLYGLRQSFAVQWLPENLFFKRYDFAYKAVQAARRYEPALVYTWVLQAGVMALMHEIPTILELHDRVTGRLGPWLFKRFIKSETSCRILTNSHALRNILIDAFADQSQDLAIQVAPNGVDLDRYDAMPAPEAARKQLGLREGFTAGYTGHFYPGRGLSLLFELAKRMPQVNFLWVGGHPSDVAEWERRINTEYVTNIQLTGLVDHSKLPAYQAACEVLMMPYGTAIAGSGGGDSSEVASPMKMFEYMAAGRAIISSDLPVIREILDDHQAVFAPPRNVSAWVNALDTLRKESSIRKRIGVAARKAVESHTWRARAERALRGFV